MNNSAGAASPTHVGGTFARGRVDKMPRIARDGQTTKYNLERNCAGILLPWTWLMKTAPDMTARETQARVKGRTHQDLDKAEEISSPNGDLYVTTMPPPRSGTRILVTFRTGIWARSTNKPIVERESISRTAAGGRHREWDLPT